MTTGATLFTGGGGADIGMMAAGIAMQWGLEIDPRIAAAANANLGGHVRTGDILSANPADFAPVDALHASPPCPNFSNAKAGAAETRHDMRLAGRICWFLRVLQPSLFTLENVWFYRRSRSWQMIENRLHTLGYWVHVAHVNAANFGVPQTRKRMLVRAVRGGWVPMLPGPQPWVSWYDAICDLIDDLPETELAPWQVASLAEMPRISSLFSEGIAKYRHGDDYPLISRPADAPAYTVTANHNMASMKAVLVNGGNPRVGNNWPTVRLDDAPAMTVTANQSKMPVRAVLVSNAKTEFGDGTRTNTKPAFTVTTQLASRARAIIDRRIVAISPRCLARWQTFPDWYELPDPPSLAIRIVGNAVPPKLMETIYHDLISHATPTA